MMDRLLNALVVVAAGIGASIGAPAGLHAQIGTPVDTTSADTTEAELAPLPSEPRPIRPEDYGRWESLGGARLSPNGEWMAVPIRRVNDEDELRIRRIGGDSAVVVGFGSNVEFSSNGRWAAYTIGMSQEARERLQNQKKRAESKLGLLDLTSGDTVVVPGVASSAFSEDGRWLAMRRYTTGSSNGDDVHGADLVVRDLRSGTDVNFGNVGSYTWQEDGTLLAMTVDAADNAGNGIRIWDPATGAIRVLHSSSSDYRNLRWDEDGESLLVLRAIEDEDREEDTHAVMVWKNVAGGGRAYALDPTEQPGFPADMRIVEHRSPTLSDDGRSVFFGIADWELKDGAREREEEADSAGEAEGEDPSASADEDDEEEAGVEVWHSRDVQIIPRQKVRANFDRRLNDLAVWHLDEDRVVRLGDEVLEDVRRLGGDRLAIGTDETPYDQERMFGPSYSDVYLIDTRTGERRPVIERVQHFYGGSPDGRYLLYLRDDHYHVYDIERDRHVNITESVPTVFVDVEDDHTVEQKPPFYLAGWTEGDRRVLLNDKYDVWEVRPDGSGGERLTQGREDSTVYRYNRVDWEEDQEAIDPDAPAYYSLRGEWSKRNGYAVSPRLDRRPERRIWKDAGVSRLTRAEEADVFAWVEEDFDDSPDYFVSRGRLAEGTQVTATNAFQDRYMWGRSELIEFTNVHGERLQGALFYPADYEPGRQYPMITYIYEIRSPSVHSYSVPSERSAYNPAVWTSQGYFVFQPDITYRPRNPGLSAVETLVPAVERVVETGMVDPERVGLVGHSWGGYQTAFVPTQTDIFAAAVAGAPLTDLVSMYLSIYWNSGGTDARIFEISQGRMEVPPWEDMASYTANSPVHNIEQLNTPMLVAFGDEDGAVDWDQGIVFYNAARRAGKDMVLLVYEGENHGLAQRPNQLDYHRRINEWFAHYLKGAPAPAWMETGVPYLEQEEGKAAPGRITGSR